MKTRACICILSMFLFCVSAQAVNNELETFDGSGAYSGFDLPNWTNIGPAGTFSAPPGQYRIASSGTPSGLQRPVGQGDFESTLYISDFTGWDTVSSGDGFKWEFWDIYMQDGISIVLDSSHFNPSKAIWIDWYRGGTKTTTTQLNIGNSVTQLKLKAVWIETTKHWELYYHINGGPDVPAETPFPDTPLTEYISPSQLNRHTRLVAYESYAMQGVTVWLDNYILAPRTGETPTDTPTPFATSTPTLTPTYTPPPFSPSEAYVSSTYGSDVVGDGSIDNPWASIVHAMNQVSGTPFRRVTIRVGQGVYVGQVQMKPWVNLLGGYQGVNTWSWTVRNPIAYKTEINPAVGQYHCVIGSHYSTLSGFFIRGGNANGTAQTDQVGGGISCDGTSPVITRCYIIGNQATQAGGGIAIKNSSAVIRGNIIANNATMAAGTFGGGIFCGLGTDDAIIEGNAIIGNGLSPAMNEVQGGGIAIQQSKPLITRNIISGNMGGSLSTVSNYRVGAGIWMVASDSRLVSNLITGNVVRGYGGTYDAAAVCISGGAPHLINNVVANNSCDATDTTKGIIGIENTTPHFVNNIFLQNANSAITELNEFTAPAQVDNNLFFGNANMYLDRDATAGARQINSVTDMLFLGFSGNLNADPMIAGVFRGVGSSVSSVPAVWQCILTDSRATWKPHAFRNRLLTLTGLTTFGAEYSHKQFLIFDNTETTITFWGDVPTVSTPFSYVVRDYHIQPSSPCVDAGLAALLLSDDKDIDGQPRTMGGSWGSGRIPDIGADEVLPSVERKARLINKSSGGSIAADFDSRYNKVSLTIPPQAGAGGTAGSGGADNLLVTMGQPDDTLGFDTTIRFEPDGTTFNPPATLRMQFDPDEIPAGKTPKNLRVYKWISLGGDEGYWQDLGEPTLDYLRNTATIPINSFSSYTLGVVLPGGPLVINGSSLIDNGPGKTSALWVTLRNNGYGTLYSVGAQLQEQPHSAPTPTPTYYTDVNTRSSTDTVRDFRWSGNNWIPAGKAGAMSRGFNFEILDAGHGEIPFRLVNFSYYGVPPLGNRSPGGTQLLDIPLFTETPLLERASITIGVSGGVLTPGSGGIYTSHHLTLPPGAVAEPTVFEISHPGDEFITASVQISPAATAFSAPVSLMLEYKDTDIPNPPGGDDPESKMALHVWNGSAWDLVPGAQTLNTSLNTVLASLPALSSEGIYGVLTDVIPPENPSDISVVTSGMDLRVSWVSPSDRSGDLASLRLYVSDGGGASWSAPIPLDKMTTFHDYPAAAGVSYLFRLTALDTRGNESGGVVSAGSLNAPEFGGIQSLTSVWSGVGLEQVTASWNSAVPVNAGSPVTYYGYISDRSLMQNFESPSFTTTSLTHDLTSLMVESKTYFVVVRAESDGTQDGNLVEQSVTVAHGESSTGIPSAFWESQ